jgi:DNA-binding transcriptional MerR regulator
MDSYLTAADAAKVLGVTPATVRLMNRRGRLRTAASSASGIRFFAREEVEALAAQRARVNALEGAMETAEAPV